MKVSLVQATLFWEDPESNLSHLEKLIGSEKTGTDLIVLPEMFTTGFTMQPEKHAAPHHGVWLDWIRKMARSKNAVITGSLSVRDSGKYYNRLYWVSPEGSAAFYDKRHLFRMGGEQQHYTAGDKRIITNLEGWNFLPQVCYDLRFPVWSRNRFTGDRNTGVGTYEYDALIYVANWPSVRSNAWRQLLIARAIENQCYVIAVNRTGHDGNNIGHSGDSVVINHLGETVLALNDEPDVIRSCELDRPALDAYRQRFPATADADDFTINP
jgi:omega-amidase